MSCVFSRVWIPLFQLLYKIHQRNRSFFVLFRNRFLVFSRSPSTTIVSNIQNASSPINLFANLPSGTFSNNNNNNNSIVANPGQSTSSVNLDRLINKINFLAKFCFQRLKVEDALNYLDRVKNQFALQPQVYNQFLDIMKEFKSQRYNSFFFHLQIIWIVFFVFSIDTQEVINRVSTLFHGHPDLIVGFNTFLPPGYKIEVSDEHHGYIQVTHPSSRTESIAIGGMPSTTYNLSITTPTATYRQTANLLSQDVEELDLVQQTAHSTSQAVNALISAATPLLTSSTKPNPKLSTVNVNSSNQTAPVDKSSSGQPVEFNHAINYVNKIKSRFHQ